MDNVKRHRVALSNPVHLLSLGFGSGLSKFMPGTCGSLAAIPLVLLSTMMLPLNAYLLLTAMVCVLGVWICGKTADALGVHDDPAIVWDEFAGMFITFIAVPLSWSTLLVGFLVFRVLDILKPWPISYFDKHVHGGIGIMLDDILAGVAALCVMHLLLVSGLLA